MRNLRITLIVMAVICLLLGGWMAFIQWAVETDNEWILGVLGFVVFFGFVYYAVRDINKEVT